MKRNRSFYLKLNSLLRKKKSTLIGRNTSANKYLDEVYECYSELKKAERKISSFDTEKLFCLTKRNKQKLEVIKENKHDFNVKIISFIDNIQFSKWGEISILNRIITHENVAKEARGKSADTNRESIDDFEEFQNHPKFEYEIIGNRKLDRNKRKKDKLKESIHNSTSPRLYRNVKEYETSNKNLQNITYNIDENLWNHTDNKVPDNLLQKDINLKKNMLNYPTNKNHKSMLKLHEKGFKKVTSLWEREKSASSIGIKAQMLNREKNNQNNTDMMIPKFLGDVPHTIKANNLADFEPTNFKISKSKSRYDNDVLSSTEKEDNVYKRKNETKNIRASDGSQNGVKMSKEEMDVIKSLAKDNFNPFLFNEFVHMKKNELHEHSERISNNKMFSRVPNQMIESNEKSSTMNMKDQLKVLKNEKLIRKQQWEDRATDSSKWNKISTPDIGDSRKGELDAICEEYGTKIDEVEELKEIIKLKDVQKEYKSSQADLKPQFNRYTSNKQSKGVPRKVKNYDQKVRDKENESNLNNLNEISQRRIDQKLKPKKAKSKHHKKKNKNNISF